MQKFIPFKKERDLGDILTVTFNFVRDNYKVLFKALVKYAGPAFLLQLFALGYYTYVSGGLGSDIFTQLSSSNNFGFSFVLSMLFMFIASILYQAFMYGTIQHSIKSYIKNNGVINIDEVGQGMSEDWLSFLGLGFAISFMIFVGAIFCFFPAIYLAVPLSLVYSIKTFDRLSFSETISHSFKLVKDNWWVTFLTLVVMTIVVYIINMVFQIPTIIYTLVKTLSSVSEGSLTDPSFTFDWVYLSLNILGNAISNIVYSILAVTVCFIYFNLNEKQNHTGAYEAIDNLGKDH